MVTLKFLEHISVTLIALACGRYAEAACDPPGTPNQEKASAVRPGEIRLEWKNTARGAINLFFDIEGQSSPSIPNVGPYDGPYGQKISHVVSGFQPKVKYCFRMWARLGENGCRSSLPSAWACASTPGAPEAPSSIGIGHPQLNDQTQLILSWGHDAEYDEQGFRVFEVGQPTYKAEVKMPNLPQAIISGLHANEKHCYFIQSYNEWGNSPNSSTACLSTTTSASGRNNMSNRLPRLHR